MKKNIRNPLREFLFESCVELFFSVRDKWKNSERLWEIEEEKQTQILKWNYVRLKLDEEKFKLEKFYNFKYLKIFRSLNFTRKLLSILPQFQNHSIIDF